MGKDVLWRIWCLGNTILAFLFYMMAPGVLDTILNTKSSQNILSLLVKTEKAKTNVMWEQKAKEKLLQLILVPLKMLRGNNFPEH